MMSDKKINDVDIVVLWVNNQDSQWRMSFEQYQKKYHGSLGADQKAIGQRRYKEWGIFQYFFRGIETHMPWVRKIHLITSSELPTWLNKNHPQLNILTHADIFADKGHLPVFNSLAIQANIAGVKDLAEQFILFDDDFFILKNTPASYFFEHGLPKDFIKLTNLNIKNEDPLWMGVVIKTMGRALEHFDWQPQNLLRLPFISSGYTALLNGYNFIYGSMSLLMPKRGCVPLSIYHYPQPLLRQNVLRVNEIFKECINATSSHRFRHPDDMIHYIYRYWHLLAGAFIPSFHSKKERYLCSLTNFNDFVHKAPKAFNKQVRFMTMNDDTKDGISQQEEESIKRVLSVYMDRCFPIKSSFEI